MTFLYKCLSCIKHYKANIRYFFKSCFEAATTAKALVVLALSFIII